MFPPIQAIERTHESTNHACSPSLNQPDLLLDLDAIHHLPGSWDKCPGRGSHSDRWIQFIGLAEDGLELRTDGHGNQARRVLRGP